jgi:hypothetical protein
MWIIPAVESSGIQEDELIEPMVDRLSLAYNVFCRDIIRTVRGGADRTNGRQAFPSLQYIL